MRYETIQEPIEVLAHFGNGGAPRPIRFLWRGRAHRVERVRGRWVTLRGRERSLHYAVSAEGVGSCELVWEVEGMRWRIESVAVDG